MTYETSFYKLLHASPGFHVIVVYVGLGIGTAGFYAAPRGMKIRKRPVNKVEI
jgi:hypothetical protein